MRILVTRTDRLGDVLLSLPALALLRDALAEAEIDFLCGAAIAEAVGPFLAARRVRPVVEPSGAYDAALYLFAPPKLMLAGRRAGIPMRIGVYSKPASLFLLSSGAWQRRSRGLRNEGEYNLELARALAKRLGAPGWDMPVAPIEIPSDPDALSGAQAALEALGVHGEYLVLHPGMGGSALNLSADGYLQILAALLAREPLDVVLSVGPAPRDRELGELIRAKRPGVRVLTGVSLPVLREVFRRSRLVIAPSTGPLHLAHYVGARTLGLYSPVRSQRPARWAPWGGNGQSVVLVPEVECPGKRECLGPRCDLYPCMERAGWPELLSRRWGASIRS